MAISYTGGCEDCGRLITTDIDGVLLNDDNSYNALIVCNYCFHKNHTPQGKRNQKLENLLDVSMLDKVKSFFLSL
jgi:hypothetical protein